MKMFADMDEVYTIFSDIYKDAYGFRPRFDTTGWTLDDFNKLGEQLRETIENNNIEYEERKQHSIEQFKTLIEQCKRYGAKDDTEAIRWLLQADDVQSMYDVDEFMYKHNLDYCKYGTYIHAIIKSNERSMLHRS